MNTPHDIIEGLGVEAIAAALDVAPLRVKRARREDQLPASWYAQLSKMHGEDLPRHLFSFKGAA